MHIVYPSRRIIIDSSAVCVHRIAKPSFEPQPNSMKKKTKEKNEKKYLHNLIFLSHGHDITVYSIFGSSEKTSRANQTHQEQTHVHRSLKIE